LSFTLAEVIRKKLPIKTFIMLSKFDISSPLKLKQSAQAVGIFEDKPINNRSYIFQNSQEDDEVQDFKTSKSYSNTKPNYHSDNNQGGRFQNNNYQNKYNKNQQRQNRFDSNNNNNSNNNNSGNNYYPKTF